MSDQFEDLKPEDISIGERTPPIPSELPILPLRDTVLFPNSFMPLAVARESSVRLIDDAIGNGKLIAVFTQRDAAVEEPQQADLYPVGTATHIHKMFKLPDGSLRLIVQGLARVEMQEVLERLHGGLAVGDGIGADRLFGCLQRGPHRRLRGGIERQNPPLLGERRNRISCRVDSS